MTFRRCLAGLLCAALPAAAAAQGNEIVFCVTEGVTYQATPKEIRDKFTPLTDIVGKAINRRARVVLLPAYNDLRARACEAGV